MVREAREEDTADLMVLAWDFAVFAGLELSRAVVWQVIDEALGREDMVLLVDEKDGYITGALLGAVEDNVLVGKVASERALFVRPERPGAALRLVPAFERWGAERGCTVASMSSLANSDPGWDHLLERRGYTLREKHFARSISR